MPQFERRLYDPAEDMEPLEGDDLEDEGSRLPLLIVIALVVLASFAGVVWLAYTQGVQRGREDVPRITAVQPIPKAATEPKKNPYAGLDIYRPKSADDEADSADVRAPVPETARPEGAKPAPAAPKSSVMETLPAGKPKAQSALQTGKLKPSAAATSTAALPRSIARPATKPAVKSPVPEQTNAASGAPRQIAPAMTPAPKPAAKEATAPRVQAQSALPKPASSSASPSAQAAASGGYVLQIGSYKSQADANASWQTYKQAHASVSGYGSDVKAADLGARGTWYRLRIGPFGTLAEATAACARLKAQGGNCFPAKR